MSSDQLKDEKLAVQKALLQYENLHGRPVFLLKVLLSVPFVLNFSLQQSITLILPSAFAFPNLDNFVMQLCAPNVTPL